ncbi:unnamed protein product [Rodentolepis nana]|uniref:Secreted protein n=1 Tax=Rodentolepis nana TaxID=102285 RepID=A0A0R3TZP1_RODNA|nr:unnamed protein product [Rodentolepis nana]
MMTGIVSWTFLLLLVAHICFSANPLQATPIEDIDPQLGAVEEDADFPSSSSSKGVEPIADIPPVDDSMLHDELSPARFVMDTGRANLISYTHEKAPPAETQPQVERAVEVHEA